MARKRYGNKKVNQSRIPQRIRKEVREQVGATGSDIAMPDSSFDRTMNDDNRWAFSDAFNKLGIGAGPTMDEQVNKAVDALPVPGYLKRPNPVGRERTFPAGTPVKEVEDAMSETWEEARGIEHAPFAPIPVPKEMPNLRLHLLRRWSDGGVFSRLTNMMDPTIDPQYERAVLKEASLWWVKDDMLDLVCAAMPSIPADVTPAELTMPANQDKGFVVFQKPWVGLDAMSGEKSTRVHAMSWGPSQVQNELCLSYSMYNYIDFGLGMDPREMQQAVEQNLISQGHSELLARRYRDRQPDGTTAYVRESDPDGDAYLLRGGAWAFLGRSDWPYSEPLSEFHIENRTHPLNETRKASLEEDRRFFSAFCALVNHRLSSEEVIHPVRAVKRQAERGGVTAPSTVRLIRLREVVRKSTSEERGETHIERTHRWFSRGHMGYRWYGPRNGKQEKRLTYVNPSIKGPADKPLIVKTEVRTWVR